MTVFARALAVFVPAVFLVGEGVGAAQRIEVLTMSPGPRVFERFGHTAIRVDDEVYNFGTFDAGDPALVRKFLRDELPYWLSVSDWDEHLRAYEDRVITVQELALSDEEADDLADRLALNALPPFRAYRYDFFLDNCATRVRDAIDLTISLPGNRSGSRSGNRSDNLSSGLSGGLAVSPAGGLAAGPAGGFPTGGALASVFRARPARGTFRDDVEAVLAPSPLLARAVSLVLNAFVDERRSRYDEAFLPRALADLLAEARRPDGRALVARTTMCRSAGRRRFSVAESAPLRSLVGSRARAPSCLALLLTAALVAAHLRGPGGPLASPSSRVGSSVWDSSRAASSAGCSASRSSSRRSRRTLAPARTPTSSRSTRGSSSSASPARASRSAAPSTRNSSGGSSTSRGPCSSPRSRSSSSTPSATRSAARQQHLGLLAVVATAETLALFAAAWLPRSAPDFARELGQTSARVRPNLAPMLGEARRRARAVAPAQLAPEARAEARDRARAVAPVGARASRLGPSSGRRSRRSRAGWDGAPVGE